MRGLITLGLGLVVGGAPLAAQHVNQFELGLFGAYTKYDKTFNLSNRMGGGARIGYFFLERVGVEGDVLFQPEYAVAGGSTMEPLIGSASLVLNLLGGEHHLLYVLGGYSRLDFGSTAPYRFTDGGIHGALGERLFISQRVALRVEARDIYTPSTKAGFGTSHASHLVFSAGFSVFDRGAPPKPPDQHPVPMPAPVPAPVPVPVSKGPCPNTPSGVTVPAGVTLDAKGCPLDSDGDGVPDYLDQCPNTPTGVTVDAKGCPLDSDGDGVPDYLDKCPNTPLGTQVDATGCPVFKDSDGDGVPDNIDRCPNTPPHTPVDAFGCPLLFPEERVPAAPGAPPRRPTVVLKGVNFQTGSSALRAESYDVLDVVAQALLDNTDIRIEIAGYTDNTGSTALNTRLSQARALAVRAYLARKGVGPLRMVARGYGPTSPLATNTTVAGRSLNRRVELHKLP